MLNYFREVQEARFASSARRIYGYVSGGFVLAAGASLLQVWHLYGFPGRPSPFLASWMPSSPESGSEKTHSKPLEAALPADSDPGGRRRETPSILPMSKALIP